MYHQTFVDPNRAHPTSSQYVLALSMDATAWFWAGPLTGQPVSVTQTGLEPTAALVWSIALLKRDWPAEMEFAMVFYSKSEISMRKVVMKGKSYLEVRICIHANEIGSLRHSVVRSVDPSGPSVDVANRNT